MSIKDLFQNSKTNKIIETETLASASAEVEGVSLVREKTKEKEEFVPPLDYSTASNFAKFGSAELYYEYAFKRIQQQYPYDGTLAERQQFENSSSYLDRYIFENQYPRTNGFVNFGINTSGGSKGSDGYYTGATNKEYIYILGGPHTASAGMAGKKLDNTFDLSTIYDAENKRENNLKIDLTVGNSIEFWLKKTGFDSSIAEKEIIYDSTNNENKHFRIFLSASSDGTSPLNIEFASAATTSSYNLGHATLTTSSIADSSWHHYAITMLSQSSGVKTRLFVDSVLNKEQTVSSPWDDIKTNVSGVISAIGAKVVDSLGDGQLISSSIDEFRFWKSERTGKQIGQNWFVNLGGGTDDSLDNIDLGIYFKFNEGITLTSSTDSTVLDYSGRLSNGHFIGYTSTTRNTGSAIILSGQTDREYKDPIIYSYHPDVKSKQEELKQLGILADSENTSLFYHLLPSWLIENDEATGKNIKYLCQIMASYFDTLHAQISFINRIKDDKYFGPLIEKDDFKNRQYKSFSDQDKPYPFSQQLLRHRGFILPNLFADATLVEEFLEHDVNEKYDRDIREVKNIIYQNLYNNILDIYKSKGTEKSFQRYLKNFGVDSDLVKLNLYADRAIHTLRDNYEFKSVKTNGANFNNADNNGASVIQNSGSDGVGYIKNPNTATKYSAYTLEAEVLFPRQPALNSADYYDKSFNTGSIFGFHRIDPTVDEYTFHGTDKTIKVLIGSTENFEHSHFIITGSDGIYLTSSTIPNLYDDQKWNMALRVKNSKYPLANLTGAIDSVFVDVDFYAVHAENNTIYNTISMSTSSITNGQLYLSSSRKVFAGAERANFTGSTLAFSDVVVTDVKYWQSYIDNDTINQHAFDSEAFGVTQPLENDSIFAVDNVSVFQKDTLALHWDFENNTKSDSGGGFTVYDASSGSSDMTGRFGWFSEITKNKHYGRGVGFVTNSTKAFDKIYLSTARRRLPSVVYTSDMITIKDQEKEFFFQDDEYMDNFYSFEKSMQAVISDEVVKMFATVVGFNNLIGQPENKYRPNYKNMDFLRQQFFETIENEPDQEKFFEFYKWIDTSVSFGIKQLYPASARFSDGILNIIESHVLERPKHQNKFPILSPSSPEIGQMMGVKALKYTWETGHSPQYKTLSNLSNINCIWQSQRKEDASSEENKIRRVVNTKRPLSSNVLLTQAGILYRREEDMRSFRNAPYTFDAVRKDTIHGGINYAPNKNREVYKGYIQPHGEKNALGVPKNVHAVGLGLGQGINDTKQCDDQTGLNKKKISFNTVVGKFSSTTGDHPLDDAYSYEYNVKGNNFAPYNLFSASVLPIGYQRIVSEEYKSGSVLTNLHSDTTDLSNEIPMQGPFTQTHVGGRQSRHISLNRHDTSLQTEGGGPTTNNIDDQYSRPEEWRILFGEHPDEAIQDGVFGMVGPDYGGPYPDPSRKIARWYRDGRTKRHYTIENIRSNSRIMGNFKRNYEVVNSVGRMENNLRFRSIEDTVDFVEPTLKTLLPSTNVNAGLFAQKAGSKGNVFGAAGNLTKASVQAFRTPEEAGNHDDNNPTKSIIMSKFSAPGSFETSTRIYMDAINAERSPYNALPFRNLMVRNSGSGEHCDETAATRLVRALRVPSVAGAQETGITGELIRYPREGSYSVSFWHKMDSTTNTTKYFYSATDLTERLYWNTHQLRWRVYQMAEGTAYKEWRWSLPASQASAAWKQYALSWNGSFSSDPTLYINAVSQSLLSQTTSGLDETCNIRKRLDTVRLMDVQGTSPSHELQGALGQFVFWKTNLSQTNVNTLYNSGNYYDLSAPSSPSVLKANVLDYWRLGEEFTASAGTAIMSGTVIMPTIGASRLTVTNEVEIVDGWDNPFILHDGQCYARVDSHNNRREGLQTNLRRHLGRFGVDPIHGPSVAGTDAEGIRLLDYAIESNFQKQHRNNHNKMKPFEYDVTPGRFASGSFSVNGISYTGSFASASFVVTGATVFGLPASGAFYMSGAYYAGAPATASFKVIGRHEPGRPPDNGSFTVKGAYSPGSQTTASFNLIDGAYGPGATAQGGFTLPSPTTVGTQTSATFNLPGAYSAGTKATGGFEVGGRTINSAASHGSFTVSGSTVDGVKASTTSPLTVVPVPKYGDRSATAFYRVGSAATIWGMANQTTAVTIGSKAFKWLTRYSYGSTPTENTNLRFVKTWTNRPYSYFASNSYAGDANDSLNAYTNNSGTALGAGNGFLLAFWFKINGNGFNSLSNGSYPIFDFLNGTGNTTTEISVYRENSNRHLYLKKWFDNRSETATTVYDDFFNTSNFGDTDWHHIVISYQEFYYNNGSSIPDHRSNGGEHSNPGFHIWVNGTAYTTDRTHNTTLAYADAGIPSNILNMNIKSSDSWPLMLDEVYLFDAGYRTFYHGIASNSEEVYVGTATWNNGTHGDYHMSSSPSNSQLPTPSNFYNSGVYFDPFSSTWSGYNKLHRLVNYWAMGDGDSGTTIQGVNNSGSGNNDLTIYNDASYYNNVDRNDAFSYTNVATTDDMWEELKTEIDTHVLNATVTNYNSHDGLDYILVRNTNLGTSDNISATGGTVVVAYNSVAVYDTISSPNFDLSSDITVGSDVFTDIRHHSYIDTGDIFSFGVSGSLTTPRTPNQTFSTMAYRWTAEEDGTSDFGPILYNNSFYNWSYQGIDISISFWSRSASDVTENQHICNFWSNASTYNSPTGDSIRIYKNGLSLRVGVSNTSGQKNYYVWNNAYELNKYSHFVIAINRGYDISSADSNWITVYKDGQDLGNADSKINSYSGNQLSITGIYIGDYPDTHEDGEFKGHITNMSIWKTELDSDDVQEIYNKGRWRDLNSHPQAHVNLIAWWELGDNKAGSNGPSGDPLTASYGAPDFASEYAMSNASCPDSKGSWMTRDSYDLTAAESGLIRLSHGIVKDTQGGVNAGNYEFWTGLQSKLTEASTIETHSSLIGPGNVTSKADIDAISNDTGSFNLRYHIDGDFSVALSKTGTTYTVPSHITGGIASRGMNPTHYIRISSSFWTDNPTVNPTLSPRPGYVDVVGAHYSGFVTGAATVVANMNPSFGSPADIQAWNNLQATIDYYAIHGNTGLNTVSYTDNGLYTATFRITSSAYPADRPDRWNSGFLSVNGDSFSIQENMHDGVTGQFENRTHTEDFLKIRDDNSNLFRELRLYNGSLPASPTTTVRYIPADIWTDDSDFWSKIATEYNAMRTAGTIAYTITNNDDGTFQLEAPAVGTAYEGKQIFASGSSKGFFNPSNFSGGTAASGIEDSETFSIRGDGDTYPITFRHGVTTAIGANSATIRSDSVTNNTMWNNVRNALSNIAGSSADFTCVHNGGGAFTLSSDETGSYSISVTNNPDSLVTSFSTTAGTSESGAPDGGTFTINGVTFEYDSGTPSGVGGGNVSITSNVSPSTFQNNVVGAINGSSLSSVLTANNSGNDVTITADQVGIAYNYAITQDNAGLTSVTDMENGENAGGLGVGYTQTLWIVKGNDFSSNVSPNNTTNSVQIEIKETGATTSTPPSGYSTGTGVVVINITDSAYTDKANLYNKIVDAINYNNDLSVTAVANTSANTITIYSDAVGGGNTEIIAETGAGVQLTGSQPVGGAAPSGVTAGHNITIGGVQFNLVTNGTQHAFGNSNNPFNVNANTNDDSDFWDNLSSSINQHPNCAFAASYSGVDGDSTSTFTVSTNLTGTIRNGQPSARTGDSFTISSTTANADNQSGARDTHTLDIRYFDGSSAESQIIIDIDQSQPYLKSSRNYYISASTPDNATFWNNILAAINENSTVITASYTHSSNTASFSLSTRAVGTAYNNLAYVDLDPPGSHNFTFPELNGDTTPGTGPHYFGGGQNPSGSQHGDQINIASTPITLVTHSAGAFEVDISPTRTDGQVFAAMIGEINAITNYTGADPGGIYSGGPKRINVICDVTGSGNSPNINSTGSSFGVISNFDGADELGADDPHQLTVAGKIFEISSDQDGESGAPVIIVSSSADTGYPTASTNTEFWNNLSGALNDTLTDYNISYIPDSPSVGKATFYITASVTGSAYNTSSFSTSGHTFMSLSPSITGGVDGYEGVRHNDRINFHLSGGTTPTYAFNIDLSGTLSDGVYTHAPDLNSIADSINHTNYPAKNLEFWNILTQSIKDRTVFDNITLTVECNNLEAEIVIVSSVTGAEHNGQFRESVGSFLGDNPSFITLQDDIEGGQTFSSIPISGSNFGKMFDNAFKDTQLPASDYQYSWTHNNTREQFSPTGSKQYTFRYADRTGKILVDGVFENTLNFPTSSIFTLD